MMRGLVQRVSAVCWTHNPEATRGEPMQSSGLPPTSLVAQGLPQQSRLQCGSGFLESFHPDERPLPRPCHPEESFLPTRTGAVLPDELFGIYMMNS